MFHSSIPHKPPTSISTTERYTSTTLPITASSRALSPVPRPLSPLQATRMPSPRPTPAMRPQSPLSPRFDPSSRYDSMQPPSPRNLHPRSAAKGNSQRRHPSGSLKLPSLPRFHPANFPSQHTSTANTPATGPNSPQQPISPMQQQRLYSEAQKQLYLFQRETIAAHAGLVAARENPVSPRLVPLGSPGPVTPLELEGQEGYLVAGARAASQRDMNHHSKELIEKLIEQEALRSTSSPTAIGSQ